MFSIGMRTYTHKFTFITQHTCTHACIHRYVGHHYHQQKEKDIDHVYKEKLHFHNTCHEIRDRKHNQFLAHMRRGEPDGVPSCIGAWRHEVWIDKDTKAGVSSSHPGS